MVENTGLLAIGRAGGEAGGELGLFGLDSLQLGAADATGAFPVSEGLMRIVDGFHGNVDSRVGRVNNGQGRSERLWDHDGIAIGVVSVGNKVVRALGKFKVAA